MSTLFSGHYLRNRSILGIGVLGYIGIVQHKEHSPKVLSIPPGTPCKQCLKFLQLGGIQFILKCNMSTLFSGHYLRTRSILDIGVMGYIGIVQHKEHSPEVWSVPPGTPFIQCVKLVQLGGLQFILKPGPHNLNCCWRHKFSIKPFLCGAEYFHVVDSAMWLK